MKLKVNFLKWSEGIPLAMLHKDTALKLGVHAEIKRVSLRSLTKYPKEMSARVNIIRDGIVKKDEIAVSQEIQKKLELRKGQILEVNLADPPKSLSLIKKKLNKKELTKKEIEEIISDIVDNELSEAEVALFISSMYSYGMSLKETVYLTEAILKSGNVLRLKEKLIADKHSIGGIPANRTTPIIVSICASSGLVMPKSSSKAITSAAGTADTIETLAPVEFSTEDLKKILKKTNAFLIWGGGIGMVPADEEIIRIEKALKIDPEAQMLASIMSKKLAVGSNYILIDIPYGKTAKVTKNKALELKKKFEKLGKIFKKKLKVVLTKGDEPIGNGIGPVLEMIDVLKVLDPEKEGPKDLEEKSLFLSGELLEMTGKAKKGKGYERAKEILKSGEAFKKFKEIIEAQGGKIKDLKPGKFSHKILSRKTGKIFEVDNKMINLLARNTGCPADKSAGVYLHKHVGEKIKKGGTIITLYSESKPRLEMAVKFYKKNKIIKIK